MLYRGHAVAAVAAANVHLAEEAAAKIKVEYEVLPSVTWVLDAMKDDAPLLHDDLRTDSMGKKGDKPTNVAAHLQFEKGNVAEGFSRPTWWSSASSARRASTRATSSRTSPSRCGTRTAG